MLTFYSLYQQPNHTFLLEHLMHLSEAFLQVFVLQLEVFVLSHEDCVLFLESFQLLVLLLHLFVQLIRLRYITFACFMCSVQHSKHLCNFNV